MRGQTPSINGRLEGGQDGVVSLRRHGKIPQFATKKNQPIAYKAIALPLLLLRNQSISSSRRQESEEQRRGRRIRERGEEEEEEEEEAE
uniref:Uncharacterized protein n=1 Tax=Oryza rufipogon TaxID=4529 RepID=A0A0E0MUR3_ORYRU